MLERDQLVLMPGESIVHDPETGEPIVVLAPEDKAALDADIEASKTGRWYEIADPEQYVRDCRARVEARRKGVGDAAASTDS